MKFKETKHERWSFDKNYKGKKNGRVMFVHYSQHNNYWYFSERTDGRSPYNSLWNGLQFTSQLECEIAAEAYCDQHE